MECHSIQFTTISINVERGIVKILFKYRYFQDLLIDIDIFQNHHIDIDIDIDIFGIALSISISISIFFRIALSISISISIFFKSVDISTIDMSYRYIEQGYRPRRNMTPTVHFPAVKVAKLNIMTGVIGNPCRTKGALPDPRYRSWWQRLIILARPAGVGDRGG